MSKYVTLSAAVLCLLVGGCGLGTSKPPGPFDGQIKALKDPDPAVRRQAAQEMAAAGKAAGKSMDVLRTMGALQDGLDDEDKQTRYWCAIALVHVALGRVPAPVGSMTRPLLTEASQDEDAEIRAAAEEALKKVGPERSGGPPGAPPQAATSKEPTETGKEPPATAKERTATGKEAPATGRGTGASEKK
jgi:hypothetical protein